LTAPPHFGQRSVFMVYSPHDAHLRIMPFNCNAYLRNSLEPPASPILETMTSAAFFIDSSAVL